MPEQTKCRACEQSARRGAVGYTDSAGLRAVVRQTLLEDVLELLSEQDRQRAVLEGSSVGGAFRRIGRALGPADLGETCVFSGL